MSRDLTLAMKLYADASRMLQGLVTGERGINKFTRNAKAQFDSFKNSITSVEGKLASLGVTIGVTATIIQSAKLDKSLIQIGQTAGGSKTEVDGLRKELFSMAKETGQPVDDLKDGFNNAVQAGLNFKEALPVIDATNKAMAVSTANAEQLTSGLTAASTAYSFDLAKPGLALNLLDQMRVAGKLGTQELENLSSIFARVGPNAAAAGFGFDQTLAFIEGLSQLERQPERLATLADSTVRLFNNLKYMKDAQKVTGVKFFNKDGSRRDAMDVIAEIKQQYDKLDTDAKRAIYIQKAFGEADLDTIKGMRLLLSGSMLNDIKRFTNEIKNAGGTIEKEVPDAINNAVDQVGRLKAALREAADGFAQPINDTLSKIIKSTMDSKKDGGLGMDGQDMMLAGGGALVGGALMMKAGRKLLSGLGTGVATGKALEEAAGVTPVFVVNMPDTGIAGLPGAPGTTKGGGGLGKYGKYALGAGSFLMSAPFGAMAAGAMGGYGAGKLLYDNVLEGTIVADAIGRSVAIAMAPFSSSARESLSADFNARKSELSGVLKVELNDNRPPKVSLTTNQPGMNVKMSNGPLMLGN